MATKVKAKQSLLTDYGKKKKGDEFEVRNSYAKKLIDAELAELVEEVSSDEEDEKAAAEVESKKHVIQEPKVSVRDNRKNESVKITPKGEGKKDVTKETGDEDGEL
jgi:hypothetical protein